MNTISLSSPQTSYCFTVTAAASGTRLDKWLAGHIEELTRSRLKALIEGGHLTRNGQIFTDPSWKIRVAEEFILTPPPLTEPLPQPENIPLDVLYEDVDLIVINKPAGLVVHPAAGHWTHTLVNALLHHCGDSLSGIGGVARPGILHRLDKETSGVMVVAKHDKAHKKLADAFAIHDIDRVYCALVHGAPRPAVGRIEASLARTGAERKKMSIVDKETHPSAKHACTNYKICTHFGQTRAKMPGDSLASRVNCQLETGRTHQIRAHMAHIGHPLLGDPVYGRPPGLAGLRPGDPAADSLISFLKKFRRQALHAKQLGFTHPISGKDMVFQTEPPADFIKLEKMLTAL